MIPISRTNISVANASILDLTDELLIQIVEHLVFKPHYDLNAYRDLTALAIAHRHFTNVVRSTLHGLETPSIPLPKAHALFQTLRKFPVWANEIKSIEITNYAYPVARPGNYGRSENGCIASPRDSLGAQDPKEASRRSSRLQ
jgi:hypothetical protein